MNASVSAHEQIPRLLSAEYGPYTTIYNRFNRWSRQGIYAARASKPRASYAEISRTVDPSSTNPFGAHQVGDHMPTTWSVDRGRPLTVAACRQLPNW
jgi:hypothetical protein